MTMASEQTRWELGLGLAFVVAVAFFMAAIATGISWLIAPVIVAGPGGGVVALVFLALDSDTNGRVAVADGEPALPTPATEAVAEAA